MFGARQLRVISPRKLFSFQRYLHFCSDFFSQVEKRVDEKAKGNFKIYNVINGGVNIL